MQTNGIRATGRVLARTIPGKRGEDVAADQPVGARLLPNAGTSDEIRQVEETLYGAVRHELDAKSVQLQDAGLQTELDPISRSGDGSNYSSYVEATLRFADGDVHDVVFFYVAREGRLVVDAASMPEWITKTIDESLKKAKDE